MSSDIAPKESNLPAIIGSNKTLADAMQKWSGELSTALPAHISIARLQKSVIVAAMQNPDILNCTTKSVFLSVLNAAQLGLDPSGGTLGHGYLVPYSVKGVKTCQFIPGYRGLIDLARRAGDFVQFRAVLVYKQDVFEVVEGINPDLIHKPALDGPRDEKSIAYVYAVAQTRDGSIRQWDWMTKADVDRIRAGSKSGKNEFGPWTCHYGEMAKKTMLRRLNKLLPMSSERMEHFRRALELDNADFAEDEKPTPREASAAIGAALIPTKNEPTPEPDNDPIGDLLGDDEPGGTTYKDGN